MDFAHPQYDAYMAMGQNPVPQENIPIPTKIDNKWVVHLP